ncbi:MAG: MtnX-like HAD-IB family phosphatase [Candidatus Omnitrophota bacterium]
MNKPTVFFDFDNTITTKDVLDGLIERYSSDDRWVELEKKWKNGEIGSRDCLKGQMEGVRVTKEALDDYIGTVEIDPYFNKLIKFFDSKKIRTMIVSDNFDYILNAVLRKNGIKDVPVYSNRLRMSKDRLIPSFPLNNKRCGDCAHCKKTTLVKKFKKGSVSVYIGDGLSDVCASKEADIVFAKGYLMKHFSEEKLPHVPFKNLKDIYEYFKRRMP